MPFPKQAHVRVLLRALQRGYCPRHYSFGQEEEKRAAACERWAWTHGPGGRNAGQERSLACGDSVVYLPLFQLPLQLCISIDEDGVTSHLPASFPPCSVLPPCLWQLECLLISRTSGVPWKKLCSGGLRRMVCVWCKLRVDECSSGCRLIPQRVQGCSRELLQKRRKVSTLYDMGERSTDGTSLFTKMRSLPRSREAVL